MAEVQKATEQAEEKSVKITPEAATVAGVISGQSNQEVHGQASAVTHAHDRTLSEPDMIAMEEHETPAEYTARVAQIQANRFGFFDSETDKLTGAGADVKVYESTAKQAVEPIPSLSPIVNEIPYGSSVKLNVQITNVPEVSEPVKPEELLQYADTAFEAGVQAVRHVETYMAKPNAVTDSLLQIGPALDNAVNYYANTPADQVLSDAQTVTAATGFALGNVLDHALTPEERAKTAGNLMPMFFFEGNVNEPIRSETVELLGLESMSESELLKLGIRRSPQEVAALHMPDVPEHLKHLEFPPISEELINSMESKGRTVRIAAPGDQYWMDLESVGANAKVIYPGCSEIIIKGNAPRVALIEEFLHGTQEKIGFLDDPDLPMHLAEVHVKDFMLRHSEMLRLTDNEKRLVQELKDRAIQGLNREGYRWTGE